MKKSVNWKGKGPENGTEIEKRNVNAIGNDKKKSGKSNSFRNSNLVLLNLIVKFCRYIVQQAAQELAAVEAEPIDSDSDMDNDNYNPPAPEPDGISDTHSEPSKVISILHVFFTKTFYFNCSGLRWQ